MKAPDFIFADVNASWPDCDYPAFADQLASDLVKYVRADLYERAIAERDAALAVLEILGGINPPPAIPPEPEP